MVLVDARRFGKRPCLAFGRFGHGIGGIVVVQAQRRHVSGDGGHGKCDNQRAPKIEIPIVHDAQGFGHNDHEGGRHRRKAGGNNHGFTQRITALGVQAVGNQQAD